MFDLRNQRLTIGWMAVLIVWGCTDSTHYESSDSHVNAAYNTQIESSVRDIGVMPHDAAADAREDISTTRACRVVDLEDNSTDDAGVDKTDPSLLTVSGTIVHNGDCLSGVEVCSIYGEGGLARSVFTNRSGAFEVSFGILTEGYMGVTLTPRKAGYQFEPRNLSQSISNSGVSELSFTAVEVGLPDYAVGQWKVVEASELPDGFEDFYGIYLHRTGDSITFENGCLFGGINCVDGLRYSDSSAFCRETFSHGVSNINEGDYDPNTQTWQITRRMWVVGGMSLSPPHYEHHLILKQEYF
jgi:hypothetical protein